jgi:hypothetical protein
MGAEEWFSILLHPFFCLLLAQRISFEIMMSETQATSTTTRPTTVIIAPSRNDNHVRSALVSCVAWICGVKMLLPVGREDSETDPKQNKHDRDLGKGELPVHSQQRFRCGSIRTTSGEELLISP